MSIHGNDLHSLMKYFLKMDITDIQKWNTG